MSNDKYYQLDFLMPGSRPWFASSRKQIRHSCTLPMKNRERPQRKQRFTFRELNLGFLLLRAMEDCFAMMVGALCLLERDTQVGQQRESPLMRTRGRRHRDLESEDVLDVVQMHLGKDAVLADADVQVAVRIDG